MPTKPQQNFLPEDWPVRVLHIEHGLTLEHPVWAAVSSSPDAGVTIYDIHHSLEFGVVLDGAQERVFANALCTLQAGDAWFAASWEPHGSRTLHSSTESIVAVFLPTFFGEELLLGVPWLAMFLVPPHARPRVRTDQTRTRVLELGRELRREILEQPPGWEQALRYGLLQLFLVLRREWEPPSENFSTHTPVNDLMRIAPAMAALYRGSNLRMSMEEAAAQCGFSASRFAVVFRRTTGMSYGQFSLRARLVQSARQLIHTEYSVETVADRCGFSNGSHLHRHFLKHYGCTPAVYRQRFR